MVRQRIIHDGVLSHFGQGDVLRHVLQVRAVVLAHDEKLARVAEHGERMRDCLKRAYCCTMEMFQQLNLRSWRRIPERFPVRRDVEKAGDFLIHVAFPQGTRERDDVLARVVRDEEPAAAFQLLG